MPTKQTLQCVRCGNLEGVARPRQYRTKILQDYAADAILTVLPYERDEHGVQWYICTGCGCLQTKDGKLSGGVSVYDDRYPSGRNSRRGAE